MIGIFDSGLGGLTVFKEVARVLPGYSLMYLGDTARTPYGNRSQELIYKFTQEAVDFLFSQGCELIIVACNTASSEALRKIQQEYLPEKYPDKRVLGVIRPVAEEAVKFSKNKRIGVVGTTGTINSGAYERELKAIDQEVQVFGQPCPLLVPLTEEGWSSRPETIKIIRKYVKPLKERKIDILILGCTHYPFLQKQFEKAVGKNIRIMNSASIVADKLQDYLRRHEEIEVKIKKGDNVFCVTDITEKFKSIAEEFLEEKIDLKKVNL